jgi:hypothetical protein
MCCCLFKGVVVREEAVCCCWMKVEDERVDAFLYESLPVHHGVSGDILYAVTTKTSHVQVQGERK